MMKRDVDEFEPVRRAARAAWREHQNKQDGGGGFRRLMVGLAVFFAIVSFGLYLVSVLLRN